ncbi:MAG: DUF5011 domain-containing protein [Flavobacteriaceae bacterium]|nr:DUF5011 domain-containing protein [Flavobacteriaceae bacterium]
MKNINLITLLLFTFFSLNLVAQTTYYVKAGGNNSGGLDEANAFTTVNNAVQAATDGDTIIIVGSINQTGQVGVGKSLSFVGQSVATITGANARMYVVSAAGKIINFTNITFQNANTLNPGAVVTITQNSDLSFTNCIFNNNTSSANGGVILGGGTGTLSVTNSLFDGNSASRGGAIAITTAGRQLLITGSTFVNNSATGTDGGALYLGGTNGLSSITNTTFFNNSVTVGTNQSKGGAIRLEGARAITIENSLIYGNFVTNGSATADSDIGIIDGVELNFVNSLSKKIVLDLGANDSFSTSIVSADLAASNLSFDSSIGKVIYDAVAVGTDSPIDFGSDGNDAGSWNSGLDFLDTTAPVITVLGVNPATVELGAIYTDAGATSDGGETVTTSGTVDTTTVGEYTITYSATDLAGNTGTATRTVNVVVTQNTIYVASIGAGNMDGTSVENAYGNFGTAMEDINSEGDKLIIIGTVTTSGANLTSKNFVFTIEGLDASSTIIGDGSSTRLFTINGATSADVTFKDLTFSGNNTTLAGGAVLFNNNAGATVTFNNCNITGNSVTNGSGGGALFFANGNLNIIDSSFENNSSSDEAGAIFGQSGTITITNTLFKSNSAASKGGALYANTANFNITGSTFYDNETTNATAAGGAAFYVAGTGSTNSITNCTFFQNTTGSTNQDYGTIRTDNGNTTVTNSLFYNNKTSNDAGPPSDWGSGPDGTQTFNTSLAQWITNNVDNQDEGAGSITGIKGGGGTPVNLISSNLTFNESSGYVEYDAVYVGENSPIDFGSDGNDVGAWNSGLTLLLDTTAPVITILGDNPATVELGAIYTDAGATSDGGETVTTSGSVDTATVGEYTITYSATDTSNNTGTATRTVNVEDSLSALDLDNKDLNIIVYPNPTSGMININGLNKYDLKVYNNLGQILLQANNTKAIDVSSLPNGVYIIRVSNGVKSSTKNFIKH